MKKQSNITEDGAFALLKLLGAEPYRNYDGVACIHESPVWDRILGHDPEKRSIEIREQASGLGSACNGADERLGGRLDIERRTCRRSVEIILTEDGAFSFYNERRECRYLSRSTSRERVNGRRRVLATVGRMGSGVSDRPNQE